MPGYPLPEIEAPDNPRIEIQQEQPTQATEALSIQAVILGKLLAANPDSDVLKQEKQFWLDRAGDYAALDAFIDACEEERHTSLIKQHKQIRRLGREQTTLVQRLEAEFAQANQRWNDLSMVKSKSLDGVEQAKYQYSHLGRFARDTEIQAAEDRVENAKNLTRIAIKEEVSALADRNQAEENFLEARGELARIVADEIRIRAALRGEPYRDPELGLEVRPT